MNIYNLLTQTPQWLIHDEKNSDIAIACRIRIARNIANYPFVFHMDDLQSTGLENQLKQILLNK